MFKEKLWCSSLRTTLFNFTLKEEVTTLNYVSYLVYVIALFSATYYFDITLVFLLRHPDYYNLSESEATRTVGNLVFYRSIVRIIIDPLCGSIHDVVPRKTFLIVFIILLVPIYILMPICRGIYPDLLLLMLFIGILLSNLYTTPILSNLVAKKSLGISMAITCLCIDLARVVSVYVFLKLNQVISIGWAMTTVGIFLCTIALFLIFGLKHIPVTGKYQNVFKQMFNALKYIKSQPIFCFYFAYNTISYAFTYLSGTYFTIFVASSFGNSEEQIQEAQALTASIKGIGNIVNAVVSGTFGFVADNITGYLGLTIACAIMAIGGIGFVVITSCNGYGIYISYILLIIGLQGSRIMVFISLHIGWKAIV